MSDEIKNQNEVDVEPLSDEDLESASGGADVCSWDDCSNGGAARLQ